MYISSNWKIGPYRPKQEHEQAACVYVLKQMFFACTKLLISLTSHFWFCCYKLRNSSE